MTAKTATRRRRAGKTPAEREAAAEARQARFAQLGEQLEEFQAGMEELDEEELADLMAAFARFTAHYSERNALLIIMQDPEATEVHGYWAWRYLGRKVAAYPEDEHAITIVAYRGGDKDKPEEGQDGQPAPAAEAGQGKQPGEISSDDLKAPKRHFALDTVHDVRRTVPLVCGNDNDGTTAPCGKPIRMTGTEKPAPGAKSKRSVHVYAHADGTREHKPYPAYEPKAPAAQAAAA